jgi:rod shape-determining protein MreD
MTRALSLGLLLFFGWAGLAVELAPGRAMPRPDVLFCVIALWSLRRPLWTASLAVFALGLARDLIGGGPAGLGAITLLMASVVLRAQAAAVRRRSVLIEWAAAAAAFALMTLAQQALLTLTLSPTPPTDDLLMRLAATALVWPAIAISLRWAVRLGPSPLPVEGGLRFERRAA